MAQRQCSNGFEGLKYRKRPLSVGKEGVRLWFCPGKATWYEEIEELYDRCLIAYQTGILPEEGQLSDQSWEFTEAFNIFVKRYALHKDLQVWERVQDYGEKVLEALAKMWGAKK